MGDAQPRPKRDDVGIVPYTTPVTPGATGIIARIYCKIIALPQTNKKSTNFR